MTSMAEDTVRMPGPLEVPVVRPALAMLYRLAVGPHADHYAPRFLAFERAGKPLAMWNWPAFLAPPIWAAYRGLWIAAMIFALLPLGGAITFMFVNDSIDRAPGLWALFAVLLIGVLPGAIAGSCADYLVYRRVRRIALAAERDSANPVDAATRAAGSHGVSWFGAAAGVAGMAVVALAVSHDLVSGWRDHVVRQQVITTLAAVRGLEREAETSLTSARLEARQSFALPSSVARRVVDDVDVSPENGRLRVRFGPSVPELAGKTILLAPTRNARREVRWLCVPVDIPAAYLPPRCLRR
ncbi:MAG: DUF2628 domain-containing protein [Casimicrobiaceae bacterium]